MDRATNKSRSAKYYTIVEPCNLDMRWKQRPYLWSEKNSIILFSIIRPLFAGY